jgi:hypothetical protein
LKYKLYQEFFIEPVYRFKDSYYPYSIPIPGVFKEFIIDVNVSEEDYNKLEAGDYYSNLVIKHITLPFRCYVQSLGWHFELKRRNTEKIFSITLYFANK